MGNHPRQVKSDEQASDWQSVLSRFQALSSGMTGEAVAALDPELNQKLANRWKLGDVSREPSGPKLAAMRRVVALLEAGAPSDYERGVLAAITKVEALLTELRALLPAQPEGEAGRTPAGRMIDAAKRQKERKGRRAEGDR